MNRSIRAPRPHPNRAFHRARNALFALLPLAAASSAFAGELTFSTLNSGLGQGTRVDLGPVKATFSGAVQVGTEIRADAQHWVGAADSMNTLNDGNLNYQRGDAFSTALEAYLQGDFRYGDAGVFISTKAWTDQALEKNKVAHGSSVNGYAADTPLSDRGFAPLSRFSNIVLDDAYVYDTLHFGTHSLLLRAGDQIIPWMTPTSIGGGLQMVNAVDYSALSRSSSIAEAAGIPSPSVYAQFKATPALTLDGYYQFRFRSNAYPGCGTFFSTSDYAQQGCDKMTLNGAILSSLEGKSVSTTDAQSAASALDYVSRGPDQKSNKGEYGLSGNYLVDGVGLFGLYYATYSSRASTTAVLRTGQGVLTPVAANLGLATPTGIAAEYERVFPGLIHMVGANFKTRLPDGTGLYSELTYRPDQPLAWNGSDFLQGVLAGKGVLARLYSTAVGTTARGYDDFKVAQLNLGASHPFGTIGGGELTWSGEAALKYVAGLPDTSVMRYGRVGWGVAPSATQTTCTGDARTCALDGFITTSSWGVRTKINDKFINVIDGLDLDPSLSLAWDVRGYSYDGIFSQGRKTAIADLRGTWRKTWTFDVSVLKTGGGTYNIVDDRSFVSISGGLKF